MTGLDEIPSLLSLILFRKTLRVRPANLLKLVPTIFTNEAADVGPLTFGSKSFVEPLPQQTAMGREVI